MAPRREGLSLEDFQRHWSTSHADVVSRLEGLRSYVQFHAVLRQGQLVAEYPGFDACSALMFDSFDAMDEAFESPAFTQAVREDEEEFVDKRRFQGVLGSWRSPDGISDVGELGPCLALRFWRTSLDVDAETLMGSLTAGRAGPTGFLVVDQAAHAGRFPAAASLVEFVDTDESASRDDLLSVGHARASSRGELLCVHLGRPLRVL